MFAEAQVVRSLVLSPVCAGFDGDTFGSAGRCVVAAGAGVVVAGGCEDAGGCVAALAFGGSEPRTSLGSNLLADAVCQD